MSALCHGEAVREHFQTADTEAFGLQPGGIVQRTASPLDQQILRVFQHLRKTGRGPSAQEVKFRQFFGLNGSDVFTVPLSLRIKQRPIASVGAPVNFTMSHTDKSSGTAESFPESSDAGEHI